MQETVILTHADTDGICAGAVSLSKFPDAAVFFTKPVSLAHDLKHTEAKKIIITDIALSKPDIPEILSLFEKKNSEILYFDHHPLKKSVKNEISNLIKLFVHEEGVSASELVYRYYQNSIPKERVWIALYGAIGDYTEHTPFVEERIKNWDKRAVYFEVSTISLGIKNEEFSGYDAKREIVRFLAEGKNPSDVPGLVRNAKDAVNREFDLYEIIKRKVETFERIGYVIDLPSYGFRGSSALFAATVTNSPLGICAHTREKYIDITMRTRDYGLKLNVLAEQAAETVGGSGGGHPHAAGAKIPKNTFKDFLKALNDVMK